MRACGTVLTTRRRVQLRAAALFDSGPGKCAVTAAILIDFLAAVPARPCVRCRGGLCGTYSLFRVWCVLACGVAR